MYAHTILNYICTLLLHNRENYPLLIFSVPLSFLVTLRVILHKKKEKGSNLLL
jgi:hypothetical protein